MVSTVPGPRLLYLLYEDSFEGSMSVLTRGSGGGVGVPPEQENGAGHHLKQRHGERTKGWETFMCVSFTPSYWPLNI